MSFVIEAWPTTVKEITQIWGERPEKYKKFGWSGGHEGIDIVAPLNTAVCAVAPGTIRLVSNLRSDGRPSAYGWRVEIEHEEGYRSLYAHLRPDTAELVQPGQAVQAGEVIGYSGNTGNSSRPHLHFSLKRSGARTPGFLPGYVDPTPFFIEFLYRPQRVRQQPDRATKELNNETDHL